MHVDETGWRTSGEGRALWTATTPHAAFFQIAEHCNREQFNTLIGTTYSGIVVSDRWNGYSHLDPNQRQVCWSHLQRDFRRHADGLGEQKSFGEQGFPLTRQAFAAWRAYQHEHHNRGRLQAEIAPIQIELRQLLQDASPRADGPAGTASSPTTCSKSGPRSGPSPPSTASNRPTIPPNAPSAHRSSTESLARHPKRDRRAVRSWPDAASSLREGMDDTLTLMRLGITGQLAKTLASTNPCESMIEIVRYTQRNVKRWQDGDMRKRWTAAGMLVAEQQLRRIIGYRDLAKLVIAIERHTLLVAQNNHNRQETREPVTV